jgi:hypothetical protein
MALSNTERQRLSREKAALRGSKSLSIGTIPIKYHKRFKELATLAKEGLLDEDITKLEKITPGFEGELKGALRVSEHHLKDANERLERLSIKTKENAQEALKASDKAIEKLTRMNNELKTELNIFKKMLWRFYWRG